MIAFSIIAAVMIIIALGFILPPLFKHQDASTKESAISISREANVEISRERMKEVKQELVDGKIDQQAFDRIKTDLEMNLAEALSNHQSKNDQTMHGRWFLLPMLILLPVIAIGIYQYTGFPLALDANNLVPQQEEFDPEKMVAALAERMEQHPDDGEGWYMLGRSYVALQRFKDAEIAFDKAYKILGDEVALLADYADAIGRGNDSDLTGRPKVLLEKALAIDPNHGKARWLSGMLAFQEKEYEKVSEYLIPLLAQSEPGTDLHKGLKRLITEARKLAGQEPLTESAVDRVNVTVNVSLSDSLADESSVDDIVFIFAKAVEGPAVPLAVAKLTVRDLPTTVVLNDAMAMRPDLKLSMHKKVSVSARVSKTGNAIATVGDFESTTELTDTASKDTINLIIEKVIE